MNLNILFDNQILNIKINNNQKDLFIKYLCQMDRPKLIRLINHLKIKLKEHKNAY